MVEGYLASDNGREKESGNESPHTFYRREVYASFKKKNEKGKKKALNNIAFMIHSSL